MLDTYKSYPFWRTRIEDVNAALDSAVIGEVHTLCTSAGGREIRYITYGDKVDYGRTANFSSACGAGNPKYYADREGKRPTVMLIGATHGQELEGVAALVNLISLLETGKDLRGEAVPEITEAYKKHNPRLILIPLYNIDGRARCVPDSLIGDRVDDVRYNGQGTWKDGTLCTWPEVKMTHPIKDAAGHLGSYFNDDGINLMHDNFFVPMAQETKALLKLVDDEAPECVVGLHGGGNSLSELLQMSYVPMYIKEGIYRLAADAAARQTALGLKSRVYPVKNDGNYPPPSFHLTTAIAHISGAVSSTFESNMGLADRADPFTAEEILLSHYCLFASMMDLAWRE